LEFGKPLIFALPPNHSKKNFELAIRIIIAAWNAVVIDSWENDNGLERELISSMQAAPKEAQIEIKRLIKRKKKKFGFDLRAVGEHWVREQDGGFVFGCEVRISVENAPYSDTLQ